MSLIMYFKLPNPKLDNESKNTAYLIVHETQAIYHNSMDWWIFNWYWLCDTASPYLETLSLNKQRTDNYRDFFSILDLMWCFSGNRTIKPSSEQKRPSSLQIVVIQMDSFSIVKWKLSLLRSAACHGISQSLSCVDKIFNPSLVLPK